MSTFPAGQPAYPESFMEPTRTSLSAIVALVFGILCPVPILGALAVLIGLVALISISRSGGRLGGTGLAVSGMILGLIGTVGWLGCGIGVGQFLSMYRRDLVAPTVQAFKAASGGDPQPLKGLLMPTSAAVATDEQILTFVHAVEGELGPVKRGPEGLLEIFRGVQAAAKPFERFSQGSSNNAIPLLVEFEQGWSVIVLQMPTNFDDKSKPGSMPVPVANIGVVTADGAKEFWLVDPALLPGAGNIIIPLPAPSKAPESEPQPPPGPQTP